MTALQARLNTLLIMPFVRGTRRSRAVTLLSLFTSSLATAEEEASRKPSLPSCGEMIQPSPNQFTLQPSQLPL